jgi:hypothetical protein
MLWDTNSLYLSIRGVFFSSPQNDRRYPDVANSPRQRATGQRIPKIPWVGVKSRRCNAARIETRVYAGVRTTLLDSKVVVYHGKASGDSVSGIPDAFLSSVAPFGIVFGFVLAFA